MTLAIIPPRGSTNRLPRKNIKLFCGKPIIAWSIEIAKKTCLFDLVWHAIKDMGGGEIDYKKTLQ